MLRDIANSSSIPFLGTIAAVSSSILSIAQTVKTNKDECMRMVAHIDELLSVVLELCLNSDDGDSLSPTTLHNIGKFADTLQKIHSFIEAQQNGSKFKRLFRQSENTAQLEACNSGLRHALEVFGVVLLWQRLRLRIFASEPKSATKSWSNFLLESTKSRNQMLSLRPAKACSI
ncbi:hypothetical protein B0H11DRAFT_16352 [Mycena galericulata]|nr:hypothetical protein B0H11DRAFT_16352 [Mycena galericulata]